MLPNLEMASLRGTNRSNLIYCYDPKRSQYKRSDSLNSYIALKVPRTVFEILLRPVTEEGHVYSEYLTLFHEG